MASGPAYWEITKRECQRRDLGHPCKGCGDPLTQLGTSIYVWKAPTFIKRFHPKCADEFNGQSPKRSAALSYNDLESGENGAIGGYADAWRRSQLSDEAIQRAAERQAAKAEIRRWPLYPTAGMLWRAGTIALQQERRDAKGVEAWKRQIAALCSFTLACGGLTAVCEEDSIPECAICLEGLEASPSKGDPEVLLLPCDPSHCYHAQCLEPWLKKSFQCPKCRADLRPLLNSQVAKTVAESIRAAQCKTSMKAMHRRNSQP